MTRLRVEQAAKILPPRDGAALPAGTRVLASVNGVETVIALDFTPRPPFGGRRCWLVCPRCWRRRAALYAAWNRIGCRECLRLRYRSQLERPDERWRRRAQRLTEALEWDGVDESARPVRPAGMWRSTFARRVQQIRALDAAAEEALDARMWPRALRLVAKWTAARR